FFDTMPWDLAVRAIRAVTDLPGVVLYVRRWLAAPLALPDGDLAAARPRNPAGLGGLARDREPVPALRVRRVDDPDVPGRRLRALRGRRSNPLRHRAAGPQGAGRAPGADERGRAGVPSGKTRI